MRRGLNASRLVPVLVLFCLSAAAHAQTQKSSDAPVPKGDESVSARASRLSSPHGSHLEPILARIGANPEQRKSITTIVMSYKPRLDPLKQEYRQKSNEFLDYIVTGKPADVVMARQGELNNLYSVIIMEYSRMRLEIRKQLTPDQCKKFEEYRRQQGWSSAR